MGLFVFWLVMAFVVAMVAGSKGRNGLAWFFYGLLLWPIALVHALVTPRSAETERERQAASGRVPCPFCAEMIMPSARVCPHCRSGLDNRGEPIVEQAPHGTSTAIAAVADELPERRDRTTRVKDDPGARVIGALAIIAGLVFLVLALRFA